VLIFRKHNACFLQNRRRQLAPIGIPESNRFTAFLQNPFAIDRFGRILIGYYRKQAIAIF
jgi:hypothetical protein